MTSVVESSGFTVRSLAARFAAFGEAIDVPLARRRVASYTPDPADPRRALVIPSDDEQSLAANIEDFTGSAKEAAAWQRL